MKTLIGAILLVAFLWQTSPARSVEASEVSLFLSQSCSSAQPGQVSAGFSWQGNDAAAAQQRVDLSLSNNGWLQGTFLSSPPLPGAATSFTWDGLLSSRTHYVRVSQQLAGGIWDSSVTFQFETLSCGQQLSPTAVAVSQLATLVVQAAAPMTGYSRAQFGPAWADVDGNGCDTRNDVLQRDLVAVVLRSGSTCIVESGTLHDPYTGTTIAFVRGVGTSNDVQIDHVVALAAAWRTGAAPDNAPPGNTVE